MRRSGCWQHKQRHPCTAAMHPGEHDAAEAAASAAAGSPRALHPLRPDHGARHGPPLQGACLVFFLLPKHERTRTHNNKTKKQDLNLLGDLIRRRCHPTPYVFASILCEQQDSAGKSKRVCCCIACINWVRRLAAPSLRPKQRTPIPMDNLLLFLQCPGAAIVKPDQRSLQRMMGSLATQVFAFCHFTAITSHNRHKLTRKRAGRRRHVLAGKDACQNSGQRLPPLLQPSSRQEHRHVQVKVHGTPVHCRSAEHLPAKLHLLHGGAARRFLHVLQEASSWRCCGGRHCAHVVGVHGEACCSDGQGHCAVRTMRIVAWDIVHMALNDKNALRRYVRRTLRG